MAGEENLKASAVETEVEDEGLEIEIADDTPEEDRGRAPMPKEIVENLEKDELDEYSVEKAKQLKKVWHDERRAKEAALREREEALRLAQQLVQENQNLKKSVNVGERAYIGSTKQAYERELQLAKSAFKSAYDAGDADKVASAQERMTKAQLALQQIAAYKPKYDETALQQPQTAVNNDPRGQWSVTPVETPTPQVDQKALTWKERNPWFGENRVMTSMAFGIHEQLVNDGVDPTSDEYYARIDKEMRRRFPESFDDSKESRKIKATVVASAKRTTAPKKVTLTTTQVTLAKRLGLTPEQYAKELIKLNGGANV